MGKANAITEETRPGLSDMMQSGAAILMPDILAAKAADLAWAGLSDEIEAEKAAILADRLLPPSDPQSQSLADLSAYMLAYTASSGSGPATVWAPSTSAVTS